MSNKKTSGAAGAVEPGPEPTGQAGAVTILEPARGPDEAGTNSLRSSEAPPNDTLEPKSIIVAPALEAKYQSADPRSNEARHECAYCGAHASVETREGVWLCGGVRCSNSHREGTSTPRTQEAPNANGEKSMRCTHCGNDICDPCWKARVDRREGSDLPEESFARIEEMIRGAKSVEEIWTTPAEAMALIREVRRRRAEVGDEYARAAALRSDKAQSDAALGTDDHAIAGMLTRLIDIIEAGLCPIDDEDVSRDVREAKKRATWLRQRAENGAKK